MLRGGAGSGSAAGPRPVAALALTVYGPMGYKSGPFAREAVGAK